MACSCRGGMKGVSKTMTITPQQLTARRTGLGTTAPAAPTPIAVAPTLFAMAGAITPHSTQAGMAAERRAAEKKRRDTLRNKLGR